MIHPSLSKKMIRGLVGILAGGAVVALALVYLYKPDPKAPETTPTASSEHTRDRTSALDPTLPPSGNFDLRHWKITVPVDDDGNKRADEVSAQKLASGYQHNEYFYTARDGGMVFMARASGARTSSGSAARTELREMLSNTNSAGTPGNNWVFSAFNATHQTQAGGVDGRLNATLKVDHVTTTGRSDKVGRVIIGQIHAKDNEPARLYYRKLPHHTLGSIYLAHEAEAKQIPEQWFDLIGNRSSGASNPVDGIALGEVFSYTIKVRGHELVVTIRRAGKVYVVQTVDMSRSGYHSPGLTEYMYFKAGVYNQNNHEPTQTGTADPDDYVQATFYKLSATHGTR